VPGPEPEREALVIVRRKLFEGASRSRVTPKGFPNPARPFGKPPGDQAGVIRYAARHVWEATDPGEG